MHYRDFFISHNIVAAAENLTAIDLGAGSGFQSIALSQVGYHVIAVDFCDKLLNELIKNDKNRQIATVTADIMDFTSYAGKRPELISCMGDTLPHLPDLAAVEKLLVNCSIELLPGGRLVLAFRSYSPELTATERFIPVKSESDRIFTCFIENHPKYVEVYDIVNIKSKGNWKQEISSYNKIKIDRQFVISKLTENGFIIEFNELLKGMVTIIAKKQIKKLMN